MANAAKNYKRRKFKEDEYNRKRKKRNEFLKRKILDDDRIDLLMTEVLKYKCEDFHLLMYYHRKKKYARNDKQRWHLTLAPRGGGKTTIMTISSIILDILRNPNIRILIASKTDSNGVEMLHEIKKKLESKRLIEIFGKQKGDVWNDGEIVSRNRSEDADKGKTVSTLGIGSAIASRHFDKIYADDLVDEFNSITEGQRTKISNWFWKILDPTLMPNGQISIIGTRYHHSDLYGELIDKIFTKTNKKGKVTKKYYIRVPALILKYNYKRFRKAKNRFISFWPEMFSVKYLLKKKRNQGSIIFNSQYQNDVEGMKGKIFQNDWFKWYQAGDVDINDLMIFEGVDLAIKQKENADKFATCTIGVHKKTKNIYILSYYNRVTHYSKQKLILQRNTAKFDPIRVGVESNGYQLALVQDMETDPKLKHIRAVPVYTDTDKTVRAWKLSAYFERGQIFFQEGMFELQQHLLKMPDGRYKDLFDALDIAISLAFGRSRRAREYEPGVMSRAA